MASFEIVIDGVELLPALGYESCRDRHIFASRAEPCCIGHFMTMGNVLLNNGAHHGIEFACIPANDFKGILAGELENSLFLLNYLAHP